MLLTGSQLLGTPIMSLQTGKELAKTERAIINPHNLSVIAYLVEGEHLDHNPSYIRIADVRELGSLGIIIDSNDEFVEPDDIITEKNIYDLEFTLEGKHVVDDRGEKLGKVTDYVVDVDSFVIQQLSVKRPFLKSFNDDELLVHRAQVVEVNDTTIIIKSGKIKAKLPLVSTKNYVNPFRQSSPQPETANSDTSD